MGFSRSWRRQVFWNNKSRFIIILTLQICHFIIITIIIFQACSPRLLDRPKAQLVLLRSLMAFTNVVTQRGRLNVAPPLKLPPSRGNKLWPFSWHLGEPIHSQLPAAARRDFSPAIFKASYLFYFFLAKASVSFSPTVDKPPHFAGYFHR